MTLDGLKDNKGELMIYVTVSALTQIAVAWLWMWLCVDVLGLEGRLLMVAGVVMWGVMMVAWWVVRLVRFGAAMAKLVAAEMERQRRLKDAEKFGKVAPSGSGGRAQEPPK